MSSLDVRAIDKSDLKKKARPAVAQELTVFIAEAAFDRAIERGGKDTTREIGGVLVGEVLVDERGPYLSIVDTIDALHADEKGAELTFTHATWDHIHKEMDTKFAGKKVVGWYHTHPGFGVFLSDRDQFIHKSFFNLPFQVALVYDPKSREHGVFAWRDNETWRLRRYVIGDREHTWDGNRTTAQPDKAEAKAKATRDRDDERARDRARERDERDDDRLGSVAFFGVAAILLALVAGFLGRCVGASDGAAAASRMQLELLRARAEGSEVAIASIDNDLATIVRDAVSDRAVQAPVAMAIDQLDQALAALGGPPGAPPGTPPDLTTTAAQLRDVKTRLMDVLVKRQMAESLLAQITAYTQQKGDLRADLARDVARQRAGIGQLYAELATQVGKSDPKRVKRLLDTAATIDAGNRARYAKQLHELDPSARLADESGGLVPALPAPHELAPPVTPSGALPQRVTPAAPATPTPAAPPVGGTVPGSAPDGGSR
jgi:proteasome lid subunit RPN8/RPN11